MTLNLSDEEMSALQEIANHKEMSKTAVIKQALLLYVLVDQRLLRGERLFSATAKGKKKWELLPI